ncbi:TBC1 domain family member 5 [Penicillium subrubescens]|uniref:TBC1 domain family member 5 n=1 Tax=Penicillium subrubescens TaxID=1316194 RepID=A0A1Q5UQR9_9EURO|nr:TBC1 domain family member 5 [Penicillium subrubescens]
MRTIEETSVEREQWSQKLAESRDAYSALRAHFLKYVEHPDDLESTVDPLADDEESPWQTLRNDEKLRAEIVQDVDRCLQENFFFQEPSTKQKLTDVLFVYSKLNPDVGYRQGMHELLAPILWVIDRDSVERPAQGTSSSSAQEDGLMLDLLDTSFVEHDSFTLFLCVMQTARIYYEHGERKSANGQADVIPIVTRCQYLHQEALTIIDHELADHLHTVEVLPQIFLTALSMLLRYPPSEPHSPQAFVHDALYLEQNPTAERGSFLISKYSGRSPESSKRRSRSGIRPAMRAQLWEDFKGRSESNSPGSSPARNSPKSLEALFQDVSQGIQRRTESWGVAKAVRGAVTEARKNMQTMHYEPGPRYNVARTKPVSTMAVKGVSQRPTPTELGLQTKIDRLEERNHELATILNEALKDLRMQLDTVKDTDKTANDTVKYALDRVQSVQSCLEDSMLPLPVRSTSHATAVDQVLPETAPSVSEPASHIETPDVAEKQDQQDARPPLPVDAPKSSMNSATAKAASVTTTSATTTDGHTDFGREGPRAAVRPSLSDSGFSWMLGGNRGLSTFVSPASVPPEQTRHPEPPRSKGGSPLFGNHGDEKPRADEAKHDELALHSLSGARGPL